MLYVLRDEYLRPRRLLAALGAEVSDVIDDLFDAPAAAVAPAATDPVERRAQVHAFLAANGGL